MSISPQSLARTRDKRSHKVPARFNDTVYTLKDATEVVRTSARSRPGSLVAKREHEDDSDEEEVKLIKADIRPSGAFKKQSKSGTPNEIITTPARPLVEQVDPNSPSTPPPSTTPSPTVPTTAQSATTATPKQQTSNSNSLKKELPSSSLSTKKKANKGFSLIVKQQQQQSVAKQEDTNKPATFWPTPTATISGGVSNFNIHQSSQPIIPTTNSTPILVANGPPTTPAPTSLLAQLPPHTPASTPTPTSIPAPAHQGNRYFNNLTTNQQYGTRLLINEPLYLPRSVATIAPIAATLHQIALRARQPPFISKKAEACIAYQDERKLNYLTSNYAALVNITKHLGVADRLKLRCVNRIWKSVIDSESVWKEVLINTSDANVKLIYLTREYLDRFKTKVIVFNGYELAKSYKGHSEVVMYEFGMSLPALLPSLKRIFIRSLNSEQNTVAYNFLYGLLQSCSLSLKDRALQCQWEIKVGVDSLGIATVDLDKSDLRDPPPSNGQTDGCVELYDLKERYEKQRSIKIDIKPI